MDFTFDIRGNLTPPKAIDCSLQDFETTFVQSFEESDARSLIFENIIDILSQIEVLNVVILRHKSNSDTSGLAKQYEYLREQFYEKLKIALAENFEIVAEVHHLEKAA